MTSAPKTEAPRTVPLRLSSMAEAVVGPGRLVGVDIVSIAEVAESERHFGDRYLNRVFTEHELASCRESHPAARSASLAARFAAKEATLKVLRPSGARPDWRSIEVVKSPDGSCDLRLEGSAAQLAADANIRHISMSMTHEGGLAAAVVAAECDPSCSTSA